MIRDLNYYKERVDFLEAAIAHESWEIEQILGKILGYPLMGPEVGGDYTTVCVGDHVPATLAMEAADKIRKLQAIIENANLQYQKDQEAAETFGGDVDLVSDP